LQSKPINKKHIPTKQQLDDTQKTGEKLIKKQNKKIEQNKSNNEIKIRPKIEAPQTFSEENFLYPFVIKILGLKDIDKIEELNIEIFDSHGNLVKSFKEINKELAYKLIIDDPKNSFSTISFSSYIITGYMKVEGKVVKFNTLNFSTEIMFIETEFGKKIIIRIPRDTIPNINTEDIDKKFKLIAEFIEKNYINSINKIYITMDVYKETKQKTIDKLKGNILQYFTEIKKLKEINFIPELSIYVNNKYSRLEILLIENK